MRLRARGPGPGGRCVGVCPAARELRCEQRHAERRPARGCNCGPRWLGHDGGAGEKRPRWRPPVADQVGPSAMRSAGDTGRPSSASSFMAAARVQACAAAARGRRGGGGQHAKHAGGDVGERHRPSLRASTTRRDAGRGEGGGVVGRGLRFTPPPPLLTRLIHVLTRPVDAPRVDAHGAIAHRGDGRGSGLGERGRRAAQRTETRGQRA